MTGPAYDLTFCEIRDTSLVVEWKAPVYTGASAVAGYVVEFAKAGSSTWNAANTKAVNHRYTKVTSSRGSVQKPAIAIEDDKADTSLIIFLRYWLRVCFLLSGPHCAYLCLLLFR